MPRFLLLFVDGVGLAPEAATNPLATEPLPTLRALLGGGLTAERIGSGDGWYLGALDAALGVPGLPQSATGQTALLTGINAPAQLGRHVAAFPGPRLAALLAEHSVLRRAAAAGQAATFANPYDRRYFEAVAAGRRRHSATTLAALAAVDAGARLRDLADLTAGEACSWDVTRDQFRQWARNVEEVSADEAGRQLARLAGRHDFTLWETFMTDLAGHGRRGWTAAEALARIDGLLGGVLSGLRAESARDLTVLLTSDHGNVEESSHRSHTRNPVPLLAIGPQAPAFADLERLDQITPRLLAQLAAS